MKTRQKYLGISLFILIMALLLSFSSGDKKSFFNPDEIFYYKSSQTLTGIKELFAPKYHDTPRFQKPPLFYVLVASCFKVFGTTWSAARATSIVFSVLLLLLVYIFGKRVLGPEKSLWGAVFLGTSVLFFRFGRIVLPEMTLVFFMSGALCAGYTALLEKKHSMVYLSCLFMAIATLIKGPIGFTLPGLILLIFKFSSGKYLPAGILPWKKGCLIIAGALALWLVPSFLIYGKAFYNHLIGIEILDRMVDDPGTSSSLAAFGHYFSKLITYLPVTFIEYIPWSLAIPVLLFVFRDRPGGNNYLQMRFLIIWIFTAFGLFTLLPAKRNHYVLSYFPALSMYFAAILDLKNIKLKKALKTLTAIFIFSYFITVALLLPVFFTDGVDTLAEQTSALLEENDLPVAVSWRLDPQEIELYLNKPVRIIWEGDYVEWPIAKKTLTVFLSGPAKKDPVFYFILAKKEYNEYLNSFVSFIERFTGKNMIYTHINREWRWRKSIDLKKFIDNIQRDPKNIRSHFKAAFQEDVYLIKVHKE